jgi:23S rRNA (adenine2503-C2)-methyltransferase
MLGGVNDSDECARALAKKLRGMLCHVNLIPVNEVKESPFHPGSPEQLKRFSDILEKNGITVTVRRKLGSDIDASCGQLRLKHTEGNSV